MSNQAALLSLIVSLPELEERARQPMSFMAYMDPQRVTLSWWDLEWLRSVVRVPLACSRRWLGASAVLIGRPYCSVLWRDNSVHRGN